MTLNDLCLSTRSRNCLDNAGIKTIEALRNTSADNLLKMRNFGLSGLHEIFAALQSAGVPHVEDDLPDTAVKIDLAINGLRERIKWLESFKDKYSALEQFKDEFRAKRDEALSKMNSQ